MPTVSALNSSQAFINVSATLTRSSSCFEMAQRLASTTFQVVDETQYNREDNEERSPMVGAAATLLNRSMDTVNSNSTIRGTATIGLDEAAIGMGRADKVRSTFSRVFFKFVKVQAYVTTLCWIHLLSVLYITAYISLFLLSVVVLILFANNYRNTFSFKGYQFVLIIPFVSVVSVFLMLDSIAWNFFLSIRNSPVESLTFWARIYMKLVWDGELVEVLMTAKYSLFFFLIYLDYCLFNIFSGRLLEFGGLIDGLELIVTVLLPIHLTFRFVQAVISKRYLGVH